MKITISTIVLLLLFCLTSHAQSTFSIKGIAVDTTEKAKLSNATIMVLNGKDSTLQKFTRAKTDGSFAINNLPAGSFIVVLSYPGYADYSDSFLLSATKPEMDFGSIGMVLKSKLLNDILIKGQATAIKIKGDTTEFNARAFVVQANAKVEDLIKQFPGIQVDKDGKITAQGATVSKVLLDGEEFFGDDPTLVTKNIRADMVDKVQLYDKKSDQATFTGIDDGQTTKTLNIKLKEGKKKGYFGKADIGAGTDKFYSGQLLYNKFQDKQKFSVYGTGANTGKTGLNWDDNQKYADGNNVEYMDGGGIMFMGGGDDLYYNGQGIPVARTGGVHYDNKWGAADKYSLNTNYKIGKLDIDGTRNTITQNNLPGRIINSVSNQVNNNSTFRQKLDFTYKIQFDTTANIKIAVDGAMRNRKSATLSLDTSRRGDNTLLNLNNSDITNDADIRSFNASAFYTKKLKKKGRTISVLLGTSLNDEKSNGFLKSNIQYYDSTGVFQKAEITDQYKTGLTKGAVINTNFTYTEPLSKALSVVLNYGFNLNNGSSDQKSFDQATAGSGIYNKFVDSLSNYFKLNQQANQVGAIFNYTKGKVVLNLGTKASDVSFKQINEYTGDVFERHFINWNPAANFQYKFSQQRAFRLGFNGNTSQPSISQIQPVKNNNNPLYITLGNPDLKPSFRSNFNVSYNSYKVLSGEDLYLQGSYGMTDNPIVNNSITDAGGKTTSQYFNLTDKTPTYFRVYANYGRKIKGPDFNVGLNVSANGNTNYNMINNQLNRTTSTNYSARLSINKYKQNKFDLYGSFGPTYSINESSLQPTRNSNARGYSGYGWFGVYLPKGFEINSDMEYIYNGATKVLPQSFERFLWNAGISKKFLKEKNLKLNLTVNDLLNQNNGFERNAYDGRIVESRFTTIKRYFMFSVVYDFTKMGLNPTTK